MAGRWLLLAAAVAVASLAVTMSAPARLFPPSVYPPPASFPDWGYPNGCPSLSGVERLPPAVGLAALSVLSRFGHVSERVDLYLSDRALWPLVRQTWSHGLRPSPKRALRRRDVVLAPGVRSPYVDLIRTNCGARTLGRSLWIAVCPRDGRRRCSLATAPATTGQFMLLRRRGSWLVWWEYP